MAKKEEKVTFAKFGRYKNLEARHDWNPAFYEKNNKGSWKKSKLINLYPRIILILFSVFVM